MAAFRYYRFNFTAGSSTSIMVEEVELIGAGGTDLTSPGMAVSADGYHNGTLIPAYAFDNSHSTQWQYNVPYPHWLKVDLGAGNEQEVLRYRISGSSQTAYCPTAWTFQGSNDDSSWTTLSTVSGQSWVYPDTKTFSTPYDTVSAFSISSGAAVSTYIQAAATGETTIAAGSTVDFSASWLHRVEARISSSTDARFAGAFNKDFAFVIRGKSTFNPAPSFIAQSAFSSAPSSACAFKSAQIAIAGFDISTGADVDGRANAIIPAWFAIDSGSSPSFAGQLAAVGGFSVSDSSIASFSSSYTYSPVSPPSEGYEVVHVSTEINRVSVFE